MSKVQNGNNVSVHYTGTLSDGTKFDSSYDRGEPINFIVGSGQMIPGFDSAIPGMEVGDKKTLSLQPQEAYGDRNEEHVQTVPKTVFPSGFEFIVGGTVQGQQPNGQHFMAKICSTTDSDVVLDFNHPLAGEELTFDIELVSVS